MHDFAIRLSKLREEPRTGLSFPSRREDATRFFWIRDIRSIHPDARTHHSQKGFDQFLSGR